MKFKVDENLPSDIAELLGQAGHDASTVLQQGLGGHLETLLVGKSKVTEAGMKALQEAIPKLRFEE